MNGAAVTYLVLALLELPFAAYGVIWLVRRWGAGKEK